jgi:hypothetical protein
MPGKCESLEIKSSEGKQTFLGVASVQLPLGTGKALSTELTSGWFHMRNVLEGTHCGSALLQVLLEGAEGKSAVAQRALVSDTHAQSTETIVPIAQDPAWEDTCMGARTVHTFKVSILSIGGLPGKDQLERCGAPVPIGRYVR